MKAKIATLMIAAFMILSLASIVSAQEFHTMEGSSVSVTSEVGAWPQETVLDDAIFDAQSGPVAIEGTIFDLDLGTATWPDTAYLEIGMRPEETKESTNAGVYMIALASSAPGILVFHMQDYGGHRPGGYGAGSICVYVDAEKAKEGIDYRITLMPYKDGLGGTAYFEIWDADGTYYDGGLEPVEYGYSTKAMADANTLDEGFSEAHLFYSIMADAGGESDITYSATVGDIKTNIMTTELLEEQIRQKDEEIAEKQREIDELKAELAGLAGANERIAELQKERDELQAERDELRRQPRLSGGTTVTTSASDEEIQKAVIIIVAAAAVIVGMLGLKSLISKPKKK